MDRLDIFDRARGFQKKAPVNGGSRNKNLEYIKNRLNGTVIQDGPASILKIEYDIPRITAHGSVVLGDVYSVDTGLLEVLLPEFSRFKGGECKGSDFRDAGLKGEGFEGNGVRGSDFKEDGQVLKDLLFFDLETTGLSGGAGTHAFLIGFLKIADEGIRVTQYFLINLSSERLLLKHVREHMTSGTVLVSYNGKSFDYNILKTRYILNGFNQAEDDPVHLDLLYTSRRIWKGLFSDFSLQTVENMALRFNRTGDIPGYRVPEVYFQYLRGRDVCDELYAVFIHNKNDILSLLALLVKQLGLVRRGIEMDRTKAKGIGEPINPVSLSDMLFNGNLVEEAKSLLNVYSDNAEALKRLGLLCKKQKLTGEALNCFELLTERAEKFSDYIFACTEVAKLYEHVLKDIGKAFFYTEKVWKKVKRRDFFYPDHANLYSREKEEIEKRLRRLEKKLAAVKRF